MTSVDLFTPAEMPSALTDLILSFTLAGQRDNPAPRQLTARTNRRAGADITISGAKNIGTDAEFAAALHPHQSGQSEASCKIRHFFRVIDCNLLSKNGLKVSALPSGADC